MTTFKKMIMSFTAGAVLGILYAPARGCDTRKKIASIGEELKEGWNNVTDSIAERIDDIRDGVDNFADQTIERVEGTQFDVKDRAGFL